MKKLIAKLLDKFFPLRDLDGDLDVRRFFIVGRPYRMFPFYRLNAKIKNVRLYILINDFQMYLYATDKILIENYISLGMSEVRRV